ncbi:MAG: hypothetical protein ACYDCC_14410 [Actinomycetota bacterium]
MTKLRSKIGLVSLSLVAAGMLVPAHAASPQSGKLDMKSRTVSWSGGPLTGSAPDERDTVCTSTNCDDFMLDIEVPPRAFKAPTQALVTLTLTTQSPNDIRMMVSEPGAAHAAGSTAGYSDVGTSATLLAPKSGVWRIRAACYSCANATYSIVAQLRSYSPEPTGAFGWYSRLLPGPGQGEPGINADSSGRLFENAPGGEVTVWRSTNKGLTWDMNSTIDTISPGGSGDSDLAIAPDDGTVYVADLNSGTFTDDVFVSTDHGDTYSGPAIAGIGSDRPWLAAGPNGVVYLAYHDFGGANQVWVWRSNDHGKTFTQIGDVDLGGSSFENVTACGTGVGHPMVDPHNPNLIYMMYVTGSDVVACEDTLPNAMDFPNNQVWMARSTDGGKTWSATLAYQSKTTLGHFWPSDAIDRDGNVYIVTSETSGPDSKSEQTLSTHVILVSSHDHGQTWSAPIRVDRLGDHHSNVFPAVAAGDAGRVVVAWYTSRAMTWNDTSATWTVAFAQSLDALSGRPHFAESRATGIIHVGDICQSGLFCIFGGNRNLLDFLGITVSPDGAAEIAWASDLTGQPLDGFSREIRGPLANKPARHKVRKSH